MKPRSFRVTDPYLDAPDGSMVDGYERVGNEWKKRMLDVDKNDVPVFPGTRVRCVCGCRSVIEADSFRDDEQFAAFYPKEGRGLAQQNCEVVPPETELRPVPEVEEWTKPAPTKCSECGDRIAAEEGWCGGTGIILCDGCLADPVVQLLRIVITEMLDAAPGLRVPLNGPVPRQHASVANFLRLRLRHYGLEITKTKENP